MNYKDYQKSRDAAWQTLKTFGVSELPVMVSAICNECRFILRDYESGEGLAEKLGVADQMKKADGFTYLFNGQYYIFYRADMSVGRNRFTVAHELGHIVLGHLHENGITQLNREPDPKDNPIEQMANVYASRLLAPACVLHAVGAITPERISALCDISLRSAQFRAQRMDLLTERGKFGLSPLERDVEKQFRRFIRKTRSS